MVPNILSYVHVNDSEPCDAYMAYMALSGTSRNCIPILLSTSTTIGWYLAVNDLVF